ncbi:flavin reductase, partial [Acinetobacter nosocomialis]
MCRIVAIQQSQQTQSLVYFNRGYHQVGHQIEQDEAHSILHRVKQVEGV